jgi:glucose/mannose-6-phosphate isomerase
VARRWKGQFNENSKSFAFFEALPELNHNAVEGYRYPLDLKDKIMVVILTSALYHPKNRSRVQVTREVLARHEIPSEVVEAAGETLLAQTLWSVHLGDYVSLYLAALYQVDPSSEEVIAYFKERLAQD